VTDRASFGPVRTGRDGRFEIRGRTDAAMLRVFARAPASGVEHETRRVAVGANDVEVWFQRPGSIEGRVILDERVPPNAITMRLYRLDGDDDAQSLREPQHPAPPIGHFQWSSLRPGPVRITIEVAGEREPVYSLDWIDVPAGERARDPALVALDLRGFVRVFEVRVRDEHGVAVRRGNVLVLGDPPRSVELRDGLARIVTSAYALDLLVTVHARRPVRLARVDGDRDVQLEPALTVALHLPLAELPPAPHALKPVLVPSGSAPHDLFDAFHQAPPFDEHGTARTLVPGPGAYELRLWLGVRTGDETRYTLVGDEPFQIEVAGATVPLRLDERALARIAELLH
jgi:hypothetical protein